ncbi:MAG: hypothetical protein M3R02_17705, partial [Chloroflexota bacterium]|nr:hypothetical protein [Chloroflexota bacterium]
MTTGGRETAVGPMEPAGGYPFGPAEMMAVALARLIRDGETVFHGIASPLPMVAILLAQRLHAPNCVYLGIAGGVDPRPDTLPVSTVG